MVKKIWQISKLFGSIGWKIVEIFFALILVLGGLVLYKLNTEPVDAMKYMTEIEQAIFPSDSGYHLQAESVLLTSDLSREGLIQIDVKNLKILREDKTILLSVPSAYFSYDLWHILTLNYLPTTFVLEKSYIEMIIDEQGEMAVKTKKDESPAINAQALGKMLQKILSIKKIQVTDARIQIKDLRFKQEWDVSEIQLELTKHFRIMQTARLNAQMESNGTKSNLLMYARLNRLKKTLMLEAGIDELNLLKLSNFIPVLKKANLDAQLSLKGEFNLSKNHKKLSNYIDKLQFNLKTLRSGTLDLPEDLENLYYIHSADINGTLGAGAKALKIASSRVTLEGENPADFYLDVTGIDNFLDNGDYSKLKTVLRATLYDMSVKKVPSVWPVKTGPNAHEWVRTHLSKGKISQANFTLYFDGDELTDLFGDIQVSGVKVDYLPPMKPVEDVAAQVLLYPDKVHILANEGSIQDLSLKKADLLFTDLDKDESWLQIDLDVSGPLQQALELISSEPLEFPQMFNLKPSLVSGQAEAKVHLSFPLLDDLKTQDIQAVVHADATNIKVNSPLDYLGLDKGTLALDVSNEALKIQGDITMKNSPLHVEWNEYFEPKEITSTYVVLGNLKSKDITELFPVLKPLLVGEMKMDLKVTKNIKDNYTGILNLDAQNAFVDIAPLAVQKKSGNPMIISTTFSDISSSFQKGQISWDIYGSLEKNMDDLKIEGNADWTEKKLKIILSQVLAGPNQFLALLDTTSKDFSLVLKGKSWQAYDLKKILGEEQKKTEKIVDKKTNITLDILLDEFSLNKEKTFKNLSITGKRISNLWKSFHMQAIAKDPFVLVYDPDKNQFQGSFSDLGDLIDRVGFPGYFSGGKFSLIADQQKNGNISGNIKVQETELKETGFLIQALTILGIVDAFRGKDMLFDEIEIPFNLTPDFTLILNDAYAIGTNLGVTFKGQITVDTINLSGAVVPAYAINSLPGKIPVVGWLFRDSTGGGLINVPYTIMGPLNGPKIDWEPLKAVAPGALGRLFQ